MGVIVVNVGLVAAFAGVASLLRPLSFLRIRTRARAAALVAAGALVAIVGYALPAPLERVSSPSSRLDDFVPEYQFHESHEIRIHAPGDAVYRAVREVTAGEIRLFHTLTWLRAPRLLERARHESILHAPARDPVLSVALRSGFLLLAEEPGREIVFGTVLCQRLPAGARRDPAAFRALESPGPCKVAINFRLTPDSGGVTKLSTETRILALGASARRRFAVYWRTIYPGSALIRREWLRAIRRRAERDATPDSAGR